MWDNRVIKQDFFVTNNFKSSLIGLIYLSNPYQILLIYENGICQLYDLIKKTNIFEELICKSAKHLVISPINNTFFYSNSSSKTIFYTNLEKGFNSKPFFELPSKIWFKNKDFHDFFSSTPTKLQEQHLKEIYEESQIKFLPAHKNFEYVLIFESSNINKDGFMNQISMFFFPEAKIIRQSTVVSDECFLNNFIKIIENDLIVICPCDQRNSDNNIRIYFWDFKDDIKDLTQLNFNDPMFGQILGFNGFYEDGTLTFAIFNINEQSSTKIFFLFLSIQEKKIISSHISEKTFDFLGQNICFVGEEVQKQNYKITKFSIIRSDEKMKLYYDMIEIDYSNLEVANIHGFEWKTKDFANNPTNAKYCIEYEKEFSDKIKNGKIDQKYFRLNRIGCNRKISYLYLLEKKKFLEKYGRHIIYEIIEFLV